MIQRTSAFFFTASAVFALTLSVHTSVRADDVAQEEAYKAAKKEYGKWLKSKDPKEREAAALAYAKTNHSKAAEDVLEALTKETDNTIATVMGRSIQHLNSPECIAAIEKDVLKLKSGSELFTAYYAFQGIALGKSEGGDALIRKAILQTKDSEMYIKVAALEAIALAKHTAAADIVMELLKTKGKTWEKEHILIPISACTAAARVWNEENRFKLVESLIGVLEQYENDRIKYFAAQALSVITMQKAYWDVKFWRYWLSMEGAVGDDEGKTSARAPKPTFFDMEVVGNRVVFVIDISGSMQYPVAPPENWVKKPKSKTDNKKKVKTGEGKEGEGKEGEKEEPEKEDLDW
ncbi:MAG: hypothetical protein HUU29_12680, partial [Planctomycetaceae bacterium]|nr:hypothetical protein [Planctomycetaceae bacterium]